MDSVLIFYLREFPWCRMFCMYTLIISLVKKNCRNPRTHNFTGDRENYRFSVDQQVKHVMLLRKYKDKHFFVDIKFFKRMCL